MIGLGEVRGVVLGKGSGSSLCSFFLNILLLFIDEATHFLTARSM